MPKMKTNKGVQKRFRMSKKGKARRIGAGKGHLLTSKSKKRKRHLRRLTRLDGAGEKLIKKLLPYG